MQSDSTNGDSACPSYVNEVESPIVTDPACPNRIAGIIVNQSGSEQFENSPNFVLPEFLDGRLDVGNMLGHRGRCRFLR